MIFIGSGFGGVSRYLLSRSVYYFIGNSDFPYGTLVVNVFGGFLIGFLSVILFSRFYIISQQLRALLIIGFLGGFTTFSAFSLETFNLLQNRDLLFGFLNIILSILLSMLMTWFGVFLGRLI